MRLAPNFTLSEFACGCGCGMERTNLDRLRLLAANLQVLRDYLSGKAGRDVPITVRSGCRCPEHNRQERGATNSKHMLPIAADIIAQGHSPKQTAEAIEHLINQGRMDNGGIGVGSTIVHYDPRCALGYERARWVY